MFWLCYPTTTTALWHTEYFWYCNAPDIFFFCTNNLVNVTAVKKHKVRRRQLIFIDFQFCGQSKRTFGTKTEMFHSQHRPNTNLWNRDRHVAPFKKRYSIKRSTGSSTLVWLQSLLSHEEAETVYSRSCRYWLGPKPAGSHRSKASVVMLRVFRGAATFAHWFLLLLQEAKTGMSSPPLVFNYVFNWIELILTFILGVNTSCSCFLLEWSELTRLMHFSFGLAKTHCWWC